MKNSSHTILILVETVKKITSRTGNNVLHKGWTRFKRNEQIYCLRSLRKVFKIISWVSYTAQNFTLPNMREEA